MSSSILDTRRAPALAIHCCTLMLVFAASAAPTPLYRLYQQLWQFSTPWLTCIFAIYALLLLLALLLGARLSDHLGRRATISLALGLNIIAMVVFMLAGSALGLLLARALQGLATGLATAALGAALLDLDRQRGSAINSAAPLLGLAIGALGSTALAVHGAHPLRTVYAILGLAQAAVLALTWLSPETGTRRAGVWASLRPHVHVPVIARGPLLAVSPVNIALWMLGGFYLSLMPSLAAHVSQHASPWLGGGMVALLMLCGTVALWIALKLKAMPSLLTGALLLLVGTTAVLWSANHGSSSGLVVGSMVAGAGFGSAFLGSVRTVLPLAEPSQRGQLMAAFYIESYLAFSIPAIALGLLARQRGLLIAVDCYGLLIILLLLVALGWLVRHRHHLAEPQPA